MVRNILITIRLTVNYILLPTADVLGDINFAIRALRSHNFGIGCAMVLPVVLNMSFNLYKWTSTEYDTQKEKRFTWLLIINGSNKTIQIPKDFDAWDSNRYVLQQLLEDPILLDLKKNKIK